MKITDVAVAVFIKPDGTFLLSSRPEGKPYPGYWEFPGGKIEAGETVRDALVRELIEELNVTVTQATPWFTFMMHYTHATVRLHCWRVHAWHGNMQGMEGQSFEWVRLNQVTVSPTLPGCVPIFKALALPYVYAITNASEMGVESYLQNLRALWSKNASNGTPMLGFVNEVVPQMVQVREKNMSREACTIFTKSIIALARECEYSRDVKVLINSDFVLAHEVGADGVHLTSAQLLTLKERPDFALVGASAHTREEIERAAELKCDFVVVGPVQVTRTHPDQVPMGWTRFAELAEAAPLPCYALGGLSIAGLKMAIENGAHGVAMQRSLKNNAASLLTAGI
jgi:8-oxo-dGTP diphosphatase